MARMTVRCKCPGANKINSCLHLPMRQYMSRSSRAGVRVLASMMILIGIYVCAVSIKAYNAREKVMIGKGHRVPVSPKGTFVFGLTFLVMGSIGFWARTRERRQ